MVQLKEISVLIVKKKEKNVREMHVMVEKAKKIITKKQIQTSHPEMNIYIKLIPEIYLYKANNWNIKTR